MAFQHGMLHASDIPWSDKADHAYPSCTLLSLTSMVSCSAKPVLSIASLSCPRTPSCVLVSASSCAAAARHDVSA